MESTLNLSDSETFCRKKGINLFWKLMSKTQLKIFAFRIWSNIRFDELKKKSKVSRQTAS